MHAHAHNQAKVIAGVCDTLDVKMPKAVAEAARRLNTQLEAAGQLGPAPDALVDAIAAAIDAGTDPATDPNVLQCIVGEQIVNARQAVIAAAGTVYAESVRPQLDALLATWRPAFDRSAAELTAAHKILGDIDLHDSDSVIRLGPGGASAWADAREAVTVIDTVRKGIAATLRLTGASPTAEHLTLWLCDPGDDDRHLIRRGKKLATWDLIRAGIRLDLADSTEHRRRTAPAAAA